MPHSLVVPRRLLIASLAVAAAHAASAQSGATVRRFAEVAMAPDGQKAAWIGAESPGASAKSVMLASAGSQWVATRIDLSDADEESAAELAWSTDGRLAVLATHQKRTALYVLGADGRGRMLLDTPGTLHAISWSPDGARIAALYAGADEQANSPVAAFPRDTGVIDSHVDRQHLAIVDVAAGSMKSITPNDIYIYEYNWAPDSHRLVVSQARGSGNNNWWVARLSTVDASSGAMKDLAAPKHQIASPRWSPDGSSVAYIGGLMSDQGVTGGDVYVVSANGVTRNATPNITSSIASFTWKGNGAIRAVSYAQGQTQIATIDVKTGVMTAKWAGDPHISIGTIAGVAAISSSANGATTIAVHESFAKGPEVWLNTAGTAVQLTHINEAVASPVGRAINVRWKSETFNAQGFLLYPANYDSMKKYPMIVQVHGGPSSLVKSTFFAADAYEALESKAGYFVFLPNPRGSYGQGEAYTRANVKDFGHGDLKDIMSGIDTLLERYHAIDGTRMGIRGWSYGGFMTMWTVTQTNRFKAAVTGAGIPNWLSYTGENGISEWMVPFFGATAYENKAVYDKSSPINFINHAKTPTLVVVGERDSECPAPQSYEFWRGLQHAGVPTQLVVYPDEGHGFVKPENVLDVKLRTIKWMDAYLKAPKM